jgi:hypothetical protein
MPKFTVGDKLIRDDRYQTVPYPNISIHEITQRNGRDVYKVNTGVDYFTLLYCDTVDLLYKAIFIYNKLWNDLNENRI